jgi:beta-glucosidase/6-phospho-beta-glucosidase/beta-galactosidase
VERAVRDGYDVRGIMYWTLVDNFEVCDLRPDLPPA